jgi:hypothetical protein
MIGSPYNFSIEKWLKRKDVIRNSIYSELSYSRNIQATVELLGKDNVGVFVYEDMINDPQQYYTNICNFIGIDVAEGLELIQDAHLHKRITQGQLAFLQELDNCTIWKRWLLIIKGQKYRRRLFRTNGGDGVPANVSLPSKWEKEIADVTRVGNRWLVDNYDLSLEKYGYPL